MLYHTPTANSHIVLLPLSLMTDIPSVVFQVLLPLSLMTDIPSVVFQVLLPLSLMTDIPSVFFQVLLPLSLITDIPSVVFQVLLPLWAWRPTFWPGHRKTSSGRRKQCSQHSLPGPSCVLASPHYSIPCTATPRGSANSSTSECGGGAKWKDLGAG